MTHALRALPGVIKRDIANVMSRSFAASPVFGIASAGMYRMHVCFPLDERNGAMSRCGGLERRAGANTSSWRPKRRARLHPLPEWVVGFRAHSMSSPTSKASCPGPRRGQALLGEVVQEFLVSLRDDLDGGALQANGGMDSTWAARMARSPTALAPGWTALAAYVAILAVTRALHSLMSEHRRAPRTNQKQMQK